MTTATHSSSAAVTHERGTVSDYYAGTKDALISAGVAKLAWFPHAAQRDSRGRIKRTFSIEGEHGTIELRERRGKWELFVPVSEDERERRERAANRDPGPIADKQSSPKPEAVTLAPFADGSITEFERHHLRVLRTLSAEGREQIRYLAAGLLQVDGEAIAPHPARRRLTLVVNNPAPTGAGKPGPFAPRPAA